jgi:nucleotide-binding universal stress UspA family protein
MFKTVIVGADGSATALEAVRAAVNLVGICDATLHVVTAYDPKHTAGADLPAEFRNTMVTHPADVLLQQLQGIVEEAGVEPCMHAAAGDPADALVQVAQDEGADLIVVGNKGMKGARRVLGSVPNTVAHKAPCSVLIVDTTD